MPNREMKTFTTKVIDSATGVITAETFDIVDDKARDDLSNKISEPSDEGTNGQVLTTDGNGGRTWTTISTDLDLDDLGDVAITTPTGGQALVYDDTAAEWKNVSADSAPTSGSSNFVTSGGVYTALDGKVDKITGKGLSENDYTNADKAIVDGVTTALASKVDTSSVGTASGIAELDANGKVPSSQLPSYVDDVKEGYLNSLDGRFYEESTYETEIIPEADKIYVDKATNITYRWSGSAFVAIGSDLALGETSTTAYRGDRGKAAYDHATDANKISTAIASGFYKVGATAEGHVSSLTAVVKADITALGIPDADNLGTAATKDVATSGDASASQVVMGNDSRLTDARNAADVSAWAKAATKPTYTASEVGLGNVGNFKAVSTEASQDLTDTEKANARTNIGAGTSTFSGAYDDLTGKPTLGTAAAKDFTTSVTSGSADVVTSGAVYTYVDTVITQALNGSY